MTTTSPEAYVLLDSLIDAVAELTTEDAKGFTAYGWDSPKMGAENYGGLMPQLILGLAQDNGTPIVLMGDTLFIYSDTKGIYYEFSLEDLEPLVVALARQLNFKVEAFYGGKFDASFLKEISKRAAMSRVLGRFAKPARGVQFLDGFVSVTKRGAVKFEPGFDYNRMCTFRVELNYNDTELTECTTWNHLLRYQGFDNERIQYINAMIGNSIMGDPTNAQRCLMLVGLGGTGKSTILDTIGKAVGAHNRHDVDSLDQLTGSNGRHVAPMGHAVVTIVADSSADFRNKEMLKKIISKEPVAIEMKYKNPEPVTPRASLLLASNDSGIAYQMGDSGIRRRFDIIKFTNAVADNKRNRDIDSELEAELAMLVLTWVRALADYCTQHNSFMRPDWLDGEMQEEAINNDPVLTALAQAGLSTSANSEHGFIYVHAPDIQRVVIDSLAEQGEPNTTPRKVGTRLTNLGAPLVGKLYQGYRFRKFAIADPELLRTAAIKTHNSIA